MNNARLVSYKTLRIENCYIFANTYRIVKLIIKL